MRTIDMTPTWGEWGNVYARFAESGEVAAIKDLRRDLARALAGAQALQAINGMLTDAQQSVVNSIMTEELSKQGY